MWTRLAAAAALCLALALPAAAEDKPWRVSLVGDGFDGTSWGWKTYWRMPGDSGIPPDFTWTPSLPAKVEVQFPTPSRHVDKSGEAVGYESEVIFPVTVTPEAPKPLDLKLDLFFAVCKDVCIPATAKASRRLGAMMVDPAGSARVERVLMDVPSPGTAVAAARISTEGGKPVLKLELRERPEDIFVETTTSAYFRAPAFSPDGREASLAIDNVKDPQKLSGTTLSLTYRVNGVAREQTVALP